jgi:hypothetical protein
LAPIITGKMNNERMMDFFMSDLLKSGALQGLYTPFAPQTPRDSSYEIQ